MTSRTRLRIGLPNVGLLLVSLAAGPAVADVGVGDQAPMFASIDENLQPVDMAELILDRPLVLAVGSAS